MVPVGTAAAAGVPVALAEMCTGAGTTTPTWARRSFSVGTSKVSPGCPVWACALTVTGPLPVGTTLTSATPEASVVSWSVVGPPAAPKAPPNTESETARPETPPPDPGKEAWTATAAPDVGIEPAWARSTARVGGAVIPVAWSYQASSAPRADWVPASRSDGIGVPHSTAS